MVIIKNPTMSKKPQKSDYQPKQLESDHTVDTETMDEITSFLETFFQLYPTATEKELTYYVVFLISTQIARFGLPLFLDLNISQRHSRLLGYLFW
jgi:hypothetical protein